MSTFSGIRKKMWKPLRVLVVTVFGKGLCASWRSLIRSMALRIKVTAAGVTEVSPDGRAASFANGSSTSASIFATIPVHKLPDVVAASGIANGKPWVPVNAATLETATSNVFAIGDVNVVPSGDFAIPKAGTFAAGQGSKVGEIIAGRINETRTPEPYDGVGYCFLAYSGGRSAIVGGEFLAEGGPDAFLSEPTVSGMKSKERFERDWRNFKT